MQLTQWLKIINLDKAKSKGCTNGKKKHKMYQEKIGLEKTY